LFLPNAESPRQVRIVIADDHPIFRDGLRKLLESEPGFTVVGEADDGLAAIRAVQALEPDLLLLDVAMPRLGGIEALSALQGKHTHVLILTAGISDAAVVRAFQLGARGVVLKEAATRQLLNGIRRVITGKYVVGEGAVESMAEALARPATERDRRFSLTRRELEIIAAILAGESNKEIADHLSISIQTVKHHLTSIFDKTGVSSRLELALFAVNHRIVSDE
jgi:two-component system, NarL family, nitrate/nitrite response regulator NarL